MRPIPSILIADDPAATRSFALVIDAKERLPVAMYEIFDEGEEPIDEGTIVAMPRDNGPLLLLSGTRKFSDEDLLDHADRIASALEEIEFRDERMGFDGKS